MSEKEILGIECKFANHIPEDLSKNRPDTHIIKEVVHYKDGSFERRVKTIKNYQRCFWVTKEHKRNHTHKKESESLQNVTLYRSTQSNLHKAAGARLGYKYMNPRSLREIRKSPYVYGLDAPSGTEIVYAYKRKYPELNPTPLSVCMLDIETDVETKEIYIASIAMDNKLFTVVSRKILHNKMGVDEKIDKLLFDNIPDEDIKKDLKTSYLLVDNDLELMKGLFAKINEWKPDVVAIWNINFDIPVMMERCEHYKVDFADIISDPDIDKSMRYFYFYKDKETRVTEKGVNKAKEFHELWSYGYGSFGFWLLDAMSTYNYVRAGEAKVPDGYSLDNILDKTLGSKYKKIKFETGAPRKLIGADYHTWMVANKPLEYIVYNQWDVLSMIALNNVTRDLDLNLPVLSGIATFDVFSKNPRKIVQNFHYFCLENGYVLGSVDTTEAVDKLLGMDEWIVALPANRIKDNGIRALKETRRIFSNIHMYVFDSDQVSGYPSDGMAANVSKDTTRREIISMENLVKVEFKDKNINLMFGPVNSSDYMSTVCNFPTMFELRKKI